MDSQVHFIVLSWANPPLYLVIGSHYSIIDAKQGGCHGAAIQHKCSPDPIISQRECSIGISYSVNNTVRCGNYYELQISGQLTSIATLHKL